MLGEIKFVKAVLHYILFFYLLFENCELLVTGIGYNKNLVPSPAKNERYSYVDVSFNFKILNIEEIKNSMTMMVNIKKEWTNSDVSFQNLKNNSLNLVFDEDKDNLWIPHIQFKTIKETNDCSKADYEEINQVIPNENFYYKKNSFSNERNSFIFEGSSNKLSFNATWTCKFICNFDYTWYPFDTQNCFLHFDIFGERNQLRSNEIEYVGDYILGKYMFWKLDYCEFDKYKRRGIFIDFIYNRQLTGNFLTLFLPTGMLLLISQMSTAFSLHFLDVVIEVNATLFLVLTT